MRASLRRFRVCLAGSGPWRVRGDGRDGAANPVVNAYKGWVWQCFVAGRRFQYARRRCGAIPPVREWQAQPMPRRVRADAPPWPSSMVIGPQPWRAARHSRNLQAPRTTTAC